MILDQLLPRRNTRLAKKLPSVPVSQTPGVLFADNKSSAGVNVDANEALSLSAIFAGVNLLSSIIGALPLSVMRMAGGRRDVATWEPGHGILHTQLNPEMTASIGRRTMEFHRLLFGNEYGEIQWRMDGKPYAVWPIEPWRVRPDRDDDGTLYYLVDGRRRVEAEDMVHVPLVSADGVCGQSFVDFAISSLGLGIASQEFAARFFGNGARPGGLLVHPGTPSEDARKKFRKDWQENHAGPDNANKVGVVWGGWKWEAGAGSIAPEEAQLLESRRFQTEEVARWLNIPPHLLRDLSRATFSNIEHQGIDFVIYSLNPPLINKEQEYNRKLLRDPALYCKHNLAALLRGDQAARSAFYKSMMEMGVYTINDVLESEDLNGIGSKGDVRFVPANMMTLDRAIAGPPPQVQTPAPSPSPPTQSPPPVQSNRGPSEGAKLTLLADVFGRLGKKEANEARRAAKSPPKFLGWIDTFYADFEPTLAAALGPAVAVCGTGDAADAAAMYCGTSREDLLRAAEVPAAGLSASVESLLSTWAKTRAADEAGMLLRSLTNAEV